MFGVVNVFTTSEIYFLFLLDQNNDARSEFSSMNKQALKLCEPQRKPITVLVATNE